MIGLIVEKESIECVSSEKYGKRHAGNLPADSLL